MQAVIIDIKDRDLSESIKHAFEAANLIRLIDKSKKIYIHAPIGERLKIMGKTVPSIIKYKMTKRSRE